MERPKHDKKNALIALYVIAFGVAVLLEFLVMEISDKLLWSRPAGGGYAGMGWGTDLLVTLFAMVALTIAAGVVMGAVILLLEKALDLEEKYLITAIVVFLIMVKMRVPIAFVVLIK